MDVPREFWINDPGMNKVDRKRVGDWLDWAKTRPGWTGTSITFKKPMYMGNGFHVIEKSAYDALKKENQKLKNNNGVMQKELDEIEARRVAEHYYR